MFRAFPWIAALIVIAGCSRPPANATPAQSGTGAQATPAQPANSAKPLPAQLPNVLAHVNGEDVTRKELEDYVKNLEGRAGGAIPTDQRDRVYRDVLDQIVGFKLLLQEANARKVVVPDADVDARVGEVKKQFPSEDLFMQTLIDRKMTIEQLKKDTRKNLVIEKLIENEIAGKVEVKPDQVEKYYANNSEQFKQPERVRASHILISVAQNADAAGKAQAKEKAQSILKQLKSGKDFATLAREHSQDPGSAAQGGDLGFFQQGQMVGPFNDVAFTLKPGTTSDIVETQFGYHIIKVAEKQPARTVPLEEVRPKLEQYLKNLNRESQTDAFVKGLRAKGKVEILI